MGIIKFLFGDDYRSKAQRDQWKPSVIGKNLISPINGYGTCFKCGGTGNITLECRACSGSGQHRKTCFCCRGSGRIERDAKPCFACEGTGVKKGQTCKKCNGTGEFKPAISQVCKKCGGYGTFTETCHKCNGTGSFTVQ